MVIPQKTRPQIVAQRFILLVAVSLFLLKIYAWYITSSLAVLTDALESIINIIAATLTLLGLGFALKPKDFNHPYGHGKVEFILAIIEGFLIIAAGLGMIFQAISSINTNIELSNLDIGAAFIAFSAVTNYVCGTVAEKIGKANNSPALLASGKHLKLDSYSTLAVLGGLVFTLVSDMWWIDSSLAIFLSSYIVYSGFNILRKSIAGIMDEADSDLLSDLVLQLEKKRQQNWIDLHKVRFIKFGGRLHLDCHLTLPWYFNLREAHVEIDSFQQLVDSIFKQEVEIFVHTDDCHSYACSLCLKEDCVFRKHPFKNRITWDLDIVVATRQHSFDS